MNKLYEVCKPEPPAPSPEALGKLAFAEFLNTTMSSASRFEKDDALRAAATTRMNALLKAKSHSASNTVRTIQTMFQAASDACDLQRDRQRLAWLQTCVLQAVEYGIKAASPPDEDEYEESSDDWTEDSAEDSAEEDEQEVPQEPPKTKRNVAKAKGRAVASPRRTRKTKSADSEDEYEPSSEENSEDDAVVPETTETSEPATPKPKRTSKKKPAGKKSSDDQQVPQVPLVDEGAGAKALVKYFTTESPSCALKDGYFLRSYFFPSKTSFHSFISVLRSAKQTIDVCVFSLTDDDVADALIAAKKRGVRVRIITDDRQAAGKGADAGRLQKDHDIPFKTDNKSAYMHNKYSIVDHMTLINGSFNWSKGARFKNWENIMVTNIPETIKEFEKHFESLWAEFPDIE